MVELQGFVGLWIVDKNSGIPISSLELGLQSIDSVLFGGFLVALRGMATDFKIGQLTSFQTDYANLLITGSEDILSVIAITRETNSDCWYPTLLKINNHAETFYRNYQEKEKLVDTALDDYLVPEFKRIIMNNINSISRVSTEDCSPKKREDSSKKLKDSGLW
ncbi:MAG: hypothetical protein ACW99Q_05130 [Candidatus Kariarchaeaceae archaeon]